MGALRPIEVGAKQLWTNGLWNISMKVAAWREPVAAKFYRKLEAEAYAPDYLINVLPKHDLIYVVVPKAGSTRIRATLSAIVGRYSLQLKPKRWGMLRGPQGPRSMTARSFYRLATSPRTLRFSFVRNPYDRLLSCWANIYRGKALIPGDPQIEIYLAMRQSIDSTLPAGADRTLSFEDFVTFAVANANMCNDVHLQSQDAITTLPGISLDFIGRMESFNKDFTRVLDHLDAGENIRNEALVRLNPSDHGRCSEYYSAQLADRIYRAYERDFDRFNYPRALPS
jgi:Sulfotransferase family